MKQHTIQSSFHFEGKGLQTGLNISATFLPAEANTGVQLCRTDLPGKPTYQALADYVSATERGTVLERGAWKISTVEHALSALYAMGIDNCLIEVDGPELPDLTDYPREIAAARTFCFVREIEPLLRMGLIKGGDLQNALVIYETPMSQEGLDYMTDKLGQPRLDATKLGYLSPLNYQNEPSRHKLLDLIGDMSLLGCRIQGRIIALRPGHTFNTQCCRQLRNKII